MHRCVPHTLIGISAHAIVIRVNRRHISCNQGQSRKLSPSPSATPATSHASVYAVPGRLTRDRETSRRQSNTATASSQGRSDIKVSGKLRAFDILVIIAISWVTRDNPGTIQPSEEF